MSEDRNSLGPLVAAGIVVVGIAVAIIVGLCLLVSMLQDNEGRKPYRGEVLVQKI